MSKICTQCNGLGTPKKKSISIFFLPNVGYAEVVRKFARFVTMELKPEDRI